MELDRLVEHYAPVSGDSKFDPKNKGDRADLLKSYQGLQVMESNDQVQFSYLMVGDDTLVQNPAIPAGKLYKTQKECAEATNTAHDSFVFRHAKTLADKVYGVSPQSLHQFGLQTARAKGLYKSSKEAKKFNGTVDKVYSHTEVLDEIEADPEKFLENKIKDLSLFTQAFYRSLAEGITQEFQAYHARSAVQAMEDFGFTDFISQNIASAGRRAVRQRIETDKVKEMEFGAAAEADGLADLTRKNKIGEIEAKYGNAAEKSRGMTRGMMDLSAQVFAAEIQQEEKAAKEKEERKSRQPIPLDLDAYRQQQRAAA